MRVSFLATSMVAAIVCAPAHAQFSDSFESVTGSAAGTILSNQGGWYLVTSPASADASAYTYAGNALGLAANGSGGAQFAGGQRATTNIRAQHTVAFAAGKWTMAFDVACTFNGQLPAASVLMGSVSLQPSASAKYFIMIPSWTSATTAATWDADIIWFDAAGVQTTNNKVPNPAFQNLANKAWYHWETDFDLTTNAITETRLTDLSNGQTAVHQPQGWYVAGGAASALPLPTDVRLFVGNTAGNAIGYDNLCIVPKPAANVTVYGCANPTGSLGSSGNARLAETLTFLLDNPLGTQPPGASSVLLLGGASLPCGILIPGFGMAGPGAPGELLISAIAPITLLGTPWGGPGLPASVAIPIPNSCSLLGGTVYVQGALVAIGSPVAIGLTLAASMTIGD